MQTCLVKTENLARQVPVELRHDAEDFIVQLNHRRNNRLKFPPREVGERYCRGDLGVVLHCSFEFGIQGRVYYSVLVSHGVLRNDLHHDVSRDFKCGSGDTQDQLPVLVRDVHVVNYEQEALDRIGGVVRLKRVDQFENVGVCNSLYFSFVSLSSVFVDWARFEDGEFDPCAMCPSVCLSGKLPCDVIKTGPQVVSNFSCENAESQGDLSLAVVLNSLSEKLRIILWEGGVFAFFEKPFDLSLKIEDVLLGPF